MAVTKRLRYEVFRRDNHACRYCGATAPGATLNVDHVIPTSLGGSDKPDNLVTSCTDCNAGKTSSMPNAMPVADVEQETFNRASELEQLAAEQARALRNGQPSKETVRMAFHCHLIAVWHWAWTKRYGTEPTAEQESAAFEHLALLADGSDLPTEHLTEVAYQAGTARSTEIARFIDQRLSDEQFSLGGDAVQVWWESWEAGHDGASPSMEETATFCDGLHALVILIDATAQRDMVLRAAVRAGELGSVHVSRYLGAATQV